MSKDPTARPETPSPSFKSINDLPQPGQNINHEGKQYTTIKEGLAHILVPHGIPTSTDPKIPKEDAARQSVFYNPIQQFNRDLSVLAIKAFGEDFLICKQQLAQKMARKKKISSNQKRSVLHKRSSDVNDETKQQGTEHYEPSTKRRRINTEEVIQPISLQSEECDSYNGQNENKVVSTKNGLRSAVDDKEDTQAQGETTESTTEIITSREEPPLQEVKQQVTMQKTEEALTNSNSTPRFRILDALSATGLRALRYVQEIPFVTSVTANDMSAKAAQSIALNVKHNRLDNKIMANTGNAIGHMYSCYGRPGYEVIDLDPYGSAAQFLDSALQALNDGGLLCVTCTDSAVFASHGYLEKTYSQYGGLPFKGEACHEGGIRLILHAVASSAARYGMAIEPLLSLSIDYYIRAFVRIRKAPNEVKFLAGKTMIVYHCDSGCGAWKTQFLARNHEHKSKDDTTFYKHSFAKGPSTDRLCEHCGRKTHLSGPMYGGPLHNPAFIERILDLLPNASQDTYHTKDRIEGMLQTALEEITYGAKSTKEIRNIRLGNEQDALVRTVPPMDPAQVEDHPFFFIPSSISRVIHCSAPPVAAVRGALRHAGFRVTMSHCKPGSIRTEASWSDIWHIMREWVRQKQPLKNPLKKETAGWEIMRKAHTDQPDEASHTTEVQTAKTALEIPQAKNGIDDKTDATTTGHDMGKRTSEANSAPDFKVVFDEELGRDKDRGKYKRYQMAPRANWGPMSRAK